MTVPTFTLPPFQSGPAFPAAAIPIATELREKQLAAAGQAVALASAINKWQGALNAGDRFWTNLQAQAAAGFASSLADALSALADAQETAPAELLAAGVTDVPLTKQDIDQAFAAYWADGLPADVLTAYNQAGWNAPVAPGADPTLREVVEWYMGDQDMQMPSSVLGAATYGTADLRAAATAMRGVEAPTPRVDSILPTSGPEAGGTEVTISGSQLTDVNLVRIGPVEITPSKCDKTTCTFTTPALVGQNDVIVESIYGNSAVTATTRFASLRDPNNLLLNGGLEPGDGFPYQEAFDSFGTGPLGPWSVSGNGVDVVGPGVVVAAQGRQMVDLNGNNGEGGPSELSQVVQTSPGRRYLLEFQMAGNPNGEPVVKRLIAGVSAVSQTFEFDTTGRSNDALGWQKMSLEATVCEPNAKVFLRSLTEGKRGPNIDEIRLIDIGPGNCNPVAPDDQTSPVPTLVQQTVKSPPRTLRVGTSKKLAKRTQQGARVKWRVKSGRVCSIKAKKKVSRVMGKRPGKCGLTARAPAVPGHTSLVKKFSVKVKAKKR